MKSTKGIIWDFGGVITESPLEAFNRYELENNLPLNIISKVNSTNPDSNAWALLESVRALKSVDLPTFGKPTIPHFKAIEKFLARKINAYLLLTTL